MELVHGAVVGYEQAGGAREGDDARAVHRAGDECRLGQHFGFPCLTRHDRR